MQPRRKHPKPYTHPRVLKDLNNLQNIPELSHKPTLLEERANSIFKSHTLPVAIKNAPFLPFETQEVVNEIIPGGESCVDAERNNNDNLDKSTNKDAYKFVPPSAAKYYLW